VCQVEQGTYSSASQQRPLDTLVQSLGVVAVVALVGLERACLELVAVDVLDARVLRSGMNGSWMGGGRRRRRRGGGGT
jgi:hypothetical protein